MKKPTPIEEAIIYLAEMMERHDHDQYQVKNQVLDILGWKWVPDKKKAAPNT